MHWFKQWTQEFWQRITSHEKVEAYSTKFKDSIKDVSEQYDNSQNPYIVRLRSIMDRAAMQTDQSRALEILRTDFTEDFWVEDFLPKFTEDFLPPFVKAYLNDDWSYLEHICIGEAAIFCKNMIQLRSKSNIMLSPNILWYNDAELIEVKLDKKKTPQIVIRADVQTVDCTYERGNFNKIIEGSPSLVANNVIVMTLEPFLDEKYVKLVQFPFKVKQFNTAKQRQLV